MKKIKNSPIVDKKNKILELCQNKTVLDVGCVGQDFNYQNKHWLHGNIQKVCRDLVGVDIDRQSIEDLRKRDYNVYLVSDLENLNRSFERIVMSDVIEHVNDPVEMVKYYSRFLVGSGIMIVTTPNPFWPRQWLNILLHNDIMVSEEHTMWIDPRTFLEIINRAGLDLDSFYWLYEYYNIRELKSWDRILHYVAFIMYSMRNHYAPNMMFIVRKERDSFYSV